MCKTFSSRRGLVALASTLNANDVAVTSNGSVDGFSTDSTQSLLDLLSYFAPVLFIAGAMWLTSTASAHVWEWKSWTRLFGSPAQSQKVGSFRNPTIMQQASGSGAYTVTAFDAPSTGTSGMEGTLGSAINTSGEIAGIYSNQVGVLHGFVRAVDGAFATFDAPNAGTSPPTGWIQGTIPTCIDTAGDVAGVYIDASNAFHGFLRTADGTLTEFDAPGASTASSRGPSVMGINDAGQIVGFYTTGSYDTNSVYYGFLRAADGTITTLTAPGASSTENPSGYGKPGTIAYAINASGEIAGSYIDSSYIRHGFILSSSSSYTEFDPSGSVTNTGKGGDLSGTLATGIDAAGDVAGAYTDSNRVRHGFLRAANGTITSFDAPGANTISASGTVGGTFPLSIDPSGNYITGLYTDSSGLGHAFVYLQPLSGNDTITSLDAPGATTSATFPLSGTSGFKVNTSGVITGGYTDSNVVFHGIIVTPTTAPQIAMPTFSPAAGTYSTPKNVTISDTTPDATIYYTANGMTPTTSSTKYTGAITVSATETIEAIAVATGYTNREVASATYTITPQAATPVFSPVGSTYTNTQWVTISDASAGAAIYYTTNGTTPTTSSNVYGRPVIVSSTETLEAIAVASGYSSSAVATATYTINPAESQGFVLYSTVGNVGSHSEYPNSLITIDPITSTQQLVGQSGQAVNVAWLTADPVNNVLYGTGIEGSGSESTLYAINPNSGNISGQVTLSQGVSTIAASPQGTLYGLSGNTLGTINAATGEFSPVGTLSLASGYFLQAMTFSPGDALRCGGKWSSRRRV